MAPPVLDRRLPAIDYSLYRWLKTMDYTVGATTGTLEMHHAPLDIIPAYPDDLTTLRRSTLALTVPQPTLVEGTAFYGGDLQGLQYTGVIYGFIVSTLTDREVKFAHSRLKGDLYDLLALVACEEGVTVYEAVAPHAVIGEVDLDAVRARDLPENAPGLVPVRSRFVIEFELELV